MVHRHFFEQNQGLGFEGSKVGGSGLGLGIRV